MTKVDMNQMIQKTKLNPNQQNKIKQNRPQGQSFQDVLSKVKSSSDEVKLSKHAKARLEQRNISLTEADMKKIDEAIDKADKKGIKDALILMDNKAFVANIKNKTIITASTNEQLKENVFTNIDGAVIV
ncbi:flagellar protein [Acidaminobacter sp. JC074]|uniref:TIGR02530 family flagellar biosynthesis protein n=1 Tax=Acidaminobacter sp. JC074 TaxID=2530199 RepID=UPI001F0E8D81|nr:TIGR02530 family flagellar biosynthesis protein [Acidaminobacter sp. JC074]MCH4888725.1 flagellar protein [Acidaminobacter sp. JC074]